MSYAQLHNALHHGAAIVVLNVAFPASFRHETRRCRLLLETLLPEVLNRVVVCIGQEIVDVVLGRVVFEFIHKTRSVTFDLLGSCDCQEDNLSKFLLSERPEDATAENDWLLAGSLLHDDHGLVDTIHNQADDVGTWHAWQLLRDDIF